MYILRVVVLSCVVLAVQGCSSITSEGLVGTWKLQFAKWGTSTLVLRPDHTFHHEVYISDSRTTRTIEGTWKLAENGPSGNKWVVLESMLSLEVESLGQTRRGTTMLGVESAGLGSPLLYASTGTQNLAFQKH
jgi:hypothetical protein